MWIPFAAGWKYRHLGLQYFLIKRRCKSSLSKRFIYLLQEQNSVSSFFRILLQRLHLLLELLRKSEALPTFHLWPDLFRKIFSMKSWHFFFYYCENIVSKYLEVFGSFFKTRVSKLSGEFIRNLQTSLQGMKKISRNDALRLEPTKFHQNFSWKLSNFWMERQRYMVGIYFLTQWTLKVRLRI